MSPSPLDPVRLKEVQLLLLDVDGVLTDGTLYFGESGGAMKRFHVQDGLGIHLLQRAGIAVGIVTGRRDECVRLRAEELGLDVIALGVGEKGSAVARIILERGLARQHVAFVGDDVNDLPAMEQVGITIAVANAHSNLVSSVQFQTRLRGGDGAVREIADSILGNTWRDLVAPGGHQ